MARYGKKATKKVAKVMQQRKRGTLKSGSTGKTVKSRKQALAIGLSEARRAGGKVPKKSTAAKRTSPAGARTSATKKSTVSKAAGKKATARKTNAAKVTATKARPKPTAGRKTAARAAKRPAKSSTVKMTRKSAGASSRKKR